MRIVFMGTPEFAAASLDVLVKNGMQVVGVVTMPDKPAGRGQQISESAVKRYAANTGLPLLQPQNLKDEGFVSALRALNADVQFVVAFRMLPELVWDMPPLGTYNLHASLLPRYRGAAPINRAIMNGEHETGVTTFKLKHAVDAGNILFHEKVKIGSAMTAGELHNQLMTLGAQLLLKTARALEKSLHDKTELEFIRQDDGAASHAPKIFRNDCQIDWAQPAEKIYNQVRGLSPYPGAYTCLNHEGTTLTLKIWQARFEKTAAEGTNGLLYTDHKTYLKVRCGDGQLEIVELQLQGKRRMLVPEFLRGFKVREGTTFASEC